MQRWLTQGMQAMNLAINFSARQLSERTLAAQVARVLTQTGLDPRRLQLDLSEGLLAASFDQAIETLREISALGVQLAIDDFGTGYCSLAYLKRLPCSALKIHRSFIRRLEADEGDAAIVTAVIALAHSLGLSVVAEGIETDAQRNFLVEQRCDQGQGHWFSPALSAEAFLLA
jgi:EAL domain-containing protein (putative c-di-GMP-specific phosphodiesterase class I)